MMKAKVEIIQRKCDAKYYAKIQWPIEFLNTENRNQLITKDYENKSSCYIAVEIFLKLNKLEEDKENHSHSHSDDVVPVILSEGYIEFEKPVVKMTYSEIDNFLLYKKMLKRK